MKPNTVFFRSVCCIWILVLSSIAFTGRSPVDAQASHTFKVAVNVTCRDENTGTLIQSYIKRELRSLGDVTIVDFDNAKYVLTVVALADTYKSGRKTGGISLATAFLKRSVDDADLYYYPLIQVLSSNVEEVDLSCKDIVARF